MTQKNIKKNLLIVDDDPKILSVLEGALSHPELSLFRAADALKAFLLVRNLSPFLIISDVKMSGYGDGTRLLKLLREDPRIPQVPILFITGMPIEQAREMLPLGDKTVGLMSKPLDLPKLRDYVWSTAGIKAPAP
ncbi:MAG: response regulator [Elusimicrobiota bacterium]